LLHLFGKCKVYIPLYLEERKSLRKDALKQAHHGELAYDKKTTTYTKTAFTEHHKKSCCSGSMTFYGDKYIYRFHIVQA
jgi:hypothetical protein